MTRLSALATLRSLPSPSSRSFALLSYLSRHFPYPVSSRTLARDLNHPPSGPRFFSARARAFRDYLFSTRNSTPLLRTPASFRRGLISLINFNCLSNLEFVGQFRSFSRFILSYLLLSFALSLSFSLRQDENNPENITVKPDDDRKRHRARAHKQASKQANKQARERKKVSPVGFAARWFFFFLFSYLV